MPSELIEALKSDNLSGARVLMAEGGPLHETDDNGKGPLHWCRDRAVFFELVAAGAPLEDEDDDGIRLLQDAARGGSAERIGWLLEAGADPHGQGTDGLEPLHHAAASGDVDSVLALLAAGGDVEARTTQGASIGTTALMSAAANGQLDIAALLVQCGADLDATDDGQRSALSIATERNDDALRNWLLDHGAKPD